MYLLDTNAVSELVRHPLGKLAQRASRARAGDIVTSIICSAELWYGSERRPTGRLRFQLQEVLSSLSVLPLGDDADLHYGSLRARLERRGQVIGNNDMFIAAHALSLGATLVTDNVGEFARIDGLTIENWLRD